MTEPSPEQIAELTRRLKHETWSGFQSLAEQASTAITEQATEIAALKLQIAELMPLAKLAATCLKKSMSSVAEYAIEAGVLVTNDPKNEMSLFDLEYAPNIEATITKLLKD